MSAMNAAGSELRPAGGVVGDYHARKHRVFQRMADDQLAYRQLLADG
jgi:hypothetical protein